MKLLLTHTNSLINEVKTEDVFEGFSWNKEIFDFSNHLSQSKYYKLAIDKMKSETGCVAIEEFAGLKLKLYSLLVEENSECSKKAKGVNKNVAPTISHNKNKYALLNKKSLRY